jgi:hypothetical protein
MKKIYFVLMLSLCAISANSQTAQDLFISDSRITWLGIDFSHVRLIGSFAEFCDAGAKSPVRIITDYFPKWNRIVLDEREKYDIRGMLRKMDICYDIDMIMDLNYKTNPDSMESCNTQRFTGEVIQDCVNQYNLEGKEGIGVVFIAECLNKNYEEACFHFVAINMKTKKVLIHERLRGKPGGFGLRNYWANSVYRIINDIKYYYFINWKANFKSADSLPA